MKFRNKSSGEIRPAELREDGIYLYDKTTERWCKYTLHLLAEYWQYHEEPKEFWFIDDVGEIEAIEADGSEEEQSSKEIGNHFETKEEAERAVEKLKAWKRLKDKGFRFKTWGWEKRSGKEFTIWFTIDDYFSSTKDLDLLFGEEEE